MLEGLGAEPNSVPFCLKSMGYCHIRSKTVTDMVCQVWDGGDDIPSAYDSFPATAILGWRAEISDGPQFWTYHPNGDGTVIRLKQ